MNFLLTGGAVFRDGTFQNVDVAISKGRIVSVSPSLSRDGFCVIELHDRFLVPGFTDVHVHLREPGFSYKETLPPARRCCGRRLHRRVRHAQPQAGA